LSVSLREPGGFAILRLPIGAKTAATGETPVIRNSAPHMPRTLWLYTLIADRLPSWFDRAGWMKLYQKRKR
jgi:hypothetical protein